MRGAVSGGMALALHELGLAGAFDAAYGSSAGALNAMWLVSGRLPQGIPTWVDPRLVHALIQPRRALRGGPVVDVTTLVERRYEQLSPGCSPPSSRAGRSCTRSPPTCAAAPPSTCTGRSRTPPSLRLALRASAALPLLAGPPVELGGRRLLDAGPVGGDPVPRRARRRRHPRARAALAPRRARPRSRRAGSRAR